MSSENTLGTLKVFVIVFITSRSLQRITKAFVRIFHVSLFHLFNLLYYYIKKSPTATKYACCSCRQFLIITKQETYEIKLFYPSTLRIDLYRSIIQCGTS